MRRKYIILIFLVFSFVRLSGNNVSFHEEYLDIFIKDTTCVLRGKYYLKNATGHNINFPIYYPIAIDTIQYYPESIKIQNHKGQPIKHSHKAKGVNFSIPLPADTIIFIEIEYKQRIVQNQFEYIVKSTRSWGKPLQYARVNIHVPKRYKLTSTSFSYNDVIKDENELIYVIERENFFPEKNIIIKWKEK